MERLDYATPDPPVSPDAPAYQRYSRLQLLARLAVGMLVVAVVFALVAWPLVRFILNGGK